MDSGAGLAALASDGLCTGPRGDLADVVGQPVARRAAEICAAGGHHMLLLGPPGVAKSILAGRGPLLMRVHVVVTVGDHSRGCRSLARLRRTPALCGIPRRVPAIGVCAGSGREGDLLC